MADQRKIAWRVAQVVVVALVLWFAWRTVAADWPKVAETWRMTEIEITPLIAAAVITFASYAVLIETWRRVVAAWGGTLSFRSAAHIWIVSNLGKYIPGKIWAIIAMGGMASERGVAPAAAMGSSLLIAVINILAGVVVILLTAREALPVSTWVLFVIAGATAAVAFIPRLLPSIAQWIGQRLGRPVTWAAIPPRTIAIAFVGCTVGWILYGFAFQVIVNSIFGLPAGATRECIAAFTASYLAGYLVLPAPGGIGVREVVLADLLQRFGIATLGSAAVIVVVSRVWLTILEVVPGLILLFSFSPKRPTVAPNDARPV